jgi:hypothetical protein
MSYYQYTLRAISFVCSFKYGPLVCALTEYLELLENPVSKWIIAKSYNWIAQRYHLIIQKNKYNCGIVATIIYLSIATYISFESLPLGLLITNHKSIYAFLAICGMFSNYNPFHLTLCGLLLYLCINLYHLPTASKLHINLIEQYEPVNVIKNNHNELNDFIFVD